ncbi:hypothetical protein HK098_007158 [Nowakowskiella sp. JEL0407]|nr:hypothetical protein HK098_007158 [Nowakowskiella sp. JEL0407]
MNSIRNSKTWKLFAGPLGTGLAAIVLVFQSLGLRQSLGIYLIPMQVDIGLKRSDFGLYIAMLSLFTGLFSPIAGSISEKNKKPGLVILFGGILVLLGLYLQTLAERLGTSVGFPIITGTILGIGQAATGVSIALGAVGRLFPPEMAAKRTFYFGIVAALSQSGNFVLAPLGRFLISAVGWKGSLYILIAQGAMILPLAYPLRYQKDAVMVQVPEADQNHMETSVPSDSDMELNTVKPESDTQSDIPRINASSNYPLLNATQPSILGTSLQKVFSLPNRSTHVPSAEPTNVKDALMEAVTHGPFVLLSLAWFVCGWHIMFISANLPAYLQDRGLSPEIGAWSVSVIGIGSAIGTFLAGYLPSVTRVLTLRRILLFIYFVRGVLIVVLMTTPISDGLALTFSVLFGTAWLSTVPVTTGIIANIYGTTWLSTLSGFAFMIHQIGGFLGAYLGGLEYQLHKSYDIIWWVSCGMGFLAAIFVYFVKDETLRLFKKR